MKIILSIMTISTVFALAACQPAEGPLERAGKKVDNAAETAGDKVEDAANKLKKDVSR